MTTKVTINASCAPEQDVLVVITKKLPENMTGGTPSQEIIRLGNGQSIERYVHKTISCICISEQDNAWAGHEGK